MMRTGRFLKIERGEQSKYHGLDKSNKDFKEIKWYHKEISEREALGSELRSNPEHHTEKDCSSKYIAEETQWECHHLDTFTDQMKPSDDDINNLFNSIFTFKMKCIVENVPYNPTKSNHDNMWDNDNEYRHPECSIDIRIYRTKIIVKSRSKGQEPIQEKTVEISKQDIQKESTHKPECFWNRKIVTQNRFQK